MADAVACDSCRRIFHPRDVDVVGENDPIVLLMPTFGTSRNLAMANSMTPKVSIPWPKEWQHVCRSCREEIYMRGVVSMADDIQRKAEYLREALEAIDRQEPVGSR